MRQKGLVRLAREELIREHPTTVSVKKLQAPFEETSPALAAPDPEFTRKLALLRKLTTKARELRQSQCNMRAEVMQSRSSWSA